MKTRVCTKCGEEKPETDEYFYRHKRSRGGLYTTCKVCHDKKAREWRSENPEKVIEANRKWRAKNPEKARVAAIRWKAENPEKAREIVRRWNAENPEKARVINRRWDANNTDKRRESRKRYVDTLAPCYLKQLITIKYDIDSSEIGDKLIEAKRREMKYYRQRNQLKK